MDNRQKFIDDCIAEEAILKEEEKNKAALTIQSLWKGYMVRQRLGKYKDLPKRKLKKRKGKAKKKIVKKR